MGFLYTVLRYNCYCDSSHLPKETSINKKKIWLKAFDSSQVVKCVVILYPWFGHCVSFLYGHCINWYHNINKILILCGSTNLRKTKHFLDYSSIKKMKETTIQNKIPIWLWFICSLTTQGRLCWCNYQIFLLSAINRTFIWGCLPSTNMW